jgi:predicted DNA-binding ribbon-helix-helix protein
MTAKPAKSTTADAVRASVIRRPTGAAAAARAASTFQSADEARATSSPAAAVHEAMRTTLHLPASVRTGLKRRALDADTTMTELIRAAISAGLQDAAGLATASMAHRRTRSGARTTLDLPRDMHRTLKRLAADEDTSVQALVSAAILRAYPDLP